MRSALLWLCSIGCAIEPSALVASHPANPAAPAGRLAAPVTLRPGVVEYQGLPASKPSEPPMHHHHGQ